MMQELQTLYYHNTLLRWLMALSVALGVFAVLRLVKYITVSRLGHAPRSGALVDDAVLHVARHTWGTFQATVGVAAASLLLRIPAQQHRRLRTIIILVALLQLGVWATGLAKLAVNLAVSRHAEPGDVSHRTASNMLRFVAVIGVWSAVILLCLDNLGVNVTTLVAGLSVTGVAVALATQNIVSDLFASVSILLDKPFLVGDFIICDTFMGTVDRIGVKTTRLRSLGGELLVLANSDLVKSRLRNYRTMQERRIVFNTVLRFETSPEALRAIPGAMREIVEAWGDKARFERCHLMALTDYGFSFETVFHVLSGDYTLYAEIQHDIHVKLVERLVPMHVELASRAAAPRAAIS